MRTLELVPRIIHDNYDTPEKLAGVIRFCRKIGIREVQLVPVKSYVEPAWLPRDAHRQRCREVKKIIRVLGQNGIEGTINVVRTFMPITGTGIELIGFKQPRMNDDGKTDPYTPCPLDPVVYAAPNSFSRSTRPGKRYVL